MSPPTDTMIAPRPSYFAMRVLRLATKTALAQHLGADALVLLCVIACTEDARRYRGPVAFWNEQLLPLVGFSKWDRLDRARQKLIDAGWLMHHAGGRHKPGLYRVTIPSDLEDIGDTAVDESSTPGNGYQEGDQQGIETGNKRVSRRGTRGGTTGGTFLPVPEPLPEESASLSSLPSASKTKTKSVTQKPLVIPDQLEALIAAWNELPTGIAPRCSKRSITLVAAFRRANGQPEVQNALSDAAKLMAAIREGSFLHGQNWFKFSWLFGKDRAGEWNACKIIEGNYRDRANSNRPSAAKWQGDSNDFAHLATDASAAAAGSAGGKLDARSA